MSLQQPNETLVAQWLGRSGVEYYLCGECEGIHLTAIQALDNVTEGRLFVDEQGLLISTELDVRPATMFHLLADLTTFNIDYPHLKLFFDGVDQVCTQLVISAFFLGGEGITREQFELFVNSTIEATRKIVKECNSLEYVGLAEDMTPRNALH